MSGSFFHVLVIVRGKTVFNEEISGVSLVIKLDIPSIRVIYGWIAGHQHKHDIALAEFSNPKVSKIKNQSDINQGKQAHVFVNSHNLGRYFKHVQYL